MDLVCCLADWVFFYQEQSWVFSRWPYFSSTIYLLNALQKFLHSSVDDGVDICWSAVETHFQSL